MRWRWKWCGWWWWCGCGCGVGGITKQTEQKTGSKRTKGSVCMVKARVPCEESNAHIYIHIHMYIDLFVPFGRCGSRVGILQDLRMRLHDAQQQIIQIILQLLDALPLQQSLILHAIGNEHQFLQQKEMERERERKSQQCVLEIRIETHSPPVTCPRIFWPTAPRSRNDDPHACPTSRGQ